LRVIRLRDIRDDWRDLPAAATVRIRAGSANLGVMDRKDDTGKDEAGKNHPLVAYARYSEIGFIIPAAVFLGFFIGKGLDRWLHTKWLFLVGLILGAVAGFVEMIRMATSSSDKRKNKE